MDRWTYLKWSAVRVWALGGLSFGRVWILSSVLLFVLFVRLSLDYLYGVIAAAIIGELVSGFLNVGMTVAARRPSFPAYTAKRILDAKNLPALKSRLEEAFDHIKRYLVERLGNDGFREFVLRPLAEEESLSSSELPKTYTAMTQAFTKDIVDRANGDHQPWKSVSSGIRALGESFDRPTPDKAIRASLSRLYLRASPAYRREAASAKSEDSPATVNPHPLLTGIAKFILPPVAAAIATVIVQKLL
jgi:hypothetical protein